MFLKKKIKKYSVIIVHPLFFVMIISFLSVSNSISSDLDKKITDKEDKEKLIERKKILQAREKSTIQIINRISKKNRIKFNDDAIELVIQFSRKIEFFDENELENSLESYVKSWLLIDKKKRDFSNKDMQRFSTVERPREWGVLKVTSDPTGANLEIDDPEDKFDYSGTTPHDSFYPTDRPYTILVDKCDQIKGNKNVFVESSRKRTEPTKKEYELEECKE